MIIDPIPFTVFSLAAVACFIFVHVRGARIRRQRRMCRALEAVIAGRSVME